MYTTTRISRDDHHDRNDDEHIDDNYDAAGDNDIWLRWVSWFSSNFDNSFCDVMDV